MESEKKKKLCHLKTTPVPVIVGALGMIKKLVYKHIKKIIGSYNLFKIKIKSNALCRITHLLKRVLAMWLKKYHPQKAAKNITA